jgi:hypothetical protein
MSQATETNTLSQYSKCLQQYAKVKCQKKIKAHFFPKANKIQTLTNSGRCAE